ncbi:MAG: ATP-binding cassette domain-containing protein [Desulfomicrobium escambiense]|nr:ATP-binding cassette domain-containing protein [Desulfomicrobium escambiense]
MVQFVLIKASFFSRRSCSDSQPEHRDIWIFTLEKKITPFTICHVCNRALSLSKRFGDIQALSQVDFSVSEGRDIRAFGPNGAGKTTTIRILTGISAPTEGTARIFGRDIVQDTIAARRQMGIVHETSNIYTDLSAWQNLMFTAELYHVGKKEREKRGSRPPRAFRAYRAAKRQDEWFFQRHETPVTLCHGAHQSPTLLFLDEPTSGLDVQSNLIIRDVIRELNENGVTVFLTTHELRRQTLPATGWQSSAGATLPRLIPLSGSRMRSRASSQSRWRLIPSAVRLEDLEQISRVSGRHHVHAKPSCGCPSSSSPWSSFRPIGSLPPGLIVTHLSPHTYGNDLIHAAFSGDPHFNPVIDIMMLCIFILVFQFVANRLYKKFNE